MLGGLWVLRGVGLSEFLLVSADEFARFGAGLRSGVRVGPVVSAREFAAELRDELLLLGAWPFGLFRGGWRRAGRRAVAEVAGPPRFVVEASHVLRSRRSRASGVRSSTWTVAEHVGVPAGFVAVLGAAGAQQRPDSFDERRALGGSEERESHRLSKLPTWIGSGVVPAQGGVCR
jgi:hypothetical protein